MLFLDTCNCKIVGVEFCHTVCYGGHRDVTITLTNILNFLRANPTEIVFIEFQIDPNTYTDLINIAFSIPGFAKSLYVHPDRYAEWPRLKELIDINKVRMNLSLNTYLGLNHSGVLILSTEINCFPA